MVEVADVLVHNFRPSVPPRLGIDYDRMKVINPRLIYCALTGYGDTGPLKDRAGYDQVLQTMTGICVEQGKPGDPQIVYGSAVDFYSASMLAFAVSAALFERSRTGEGQYVGVSLLRSALTMQATRLVWADGEGRDVDARHALGRDHGPASDEERQPVHLGQYAALLDGAVRADRPSELASDPRFDTVRKRAQHAGELVPRIRAALQARTAVEWEALFGERVPCAAARAVEDMFEHPQVASEGILASFEHPRIGRYRAMAHPIHFGAGPAPAPVAAPELGQHSREILAWLGYADEEIERLHSTGAVVGPSKGARGLNAVDLLMRSKLFVPASRPELFDKALASEADAISFDLEDAVQESRKGEARGTLQAFLKETPPRPRGKILIVRVNGLRTPHFEADVAAVAWPGVDMINVPKPESAEDVRAAAAVLARCEAGRGIAQPIGLLANIESPRGLRLAVEIASAHPRVVGLQLGLGDLFEPFGIDRSDARAVYSMQLAVRLAAAEAGVWACDTVYGAVKDPDGYTREAEAARRLGFIGKSCIHPTQVPLANAVFRPSDAEIAAALRVVEAARGAEANGVGAYLVDGRMIDIPFVTRAEAIVSAARRLGLPGRLRRSKRLLDPTAARGPASRREAGAEARPRGETA